MIEACCNCAMVECGCVELVASVYLDVGVRVFRVKSCSLSYVELEEESGKRDWTRPDSALLGVRSVHDCVQGSGAQVAAKPVPLLTTMSFGTVGTHPWIIATWDT